MPILSVVGDNVRFLRRSRPLSSLSCVRLEWMRSTGSMLTRRALIGEQVRLLCQYYTVGTPVLPGKYWSTFGIKLQYFPHSTGKRSACVSRQEWKRKGTYKYCTSLFIVKADLFFYFSKVSRMAPILSLEARASLTETTISFNGAIVSPSTCMSG